MLRFLVKTLLSFLANAVGILVAASVVNGFTIHGVSFIVAVTLFTLATVILGPLVIKIALTSAPYLMGGIALVTTFVGLIITTIFTDGLSINGLSAWLASTFIVWVFSILANVLLPLVMFKKILGSDTAKTPVKNIVS
jgi:putative membrane protein